MLHHATSAARRFPLERARWTIAKRSLATSGAECNHIDINDSSKVRRVPVQLPLKF